MHDHTHMHLISRSTIDRPRPKEQSRLTKCLLHVYVDCCKDLQVSKSSAQKPSPKVELKVGQEAQHTFPKYYSAEPVYEQVRMKQFKTTSEILMMCAGILHMDMVRT